MLICNDYGLEGSWTEGLLLLGSLLLLLRVELEAQTK
jgi:hypothetical protein